MPDRPPDPYEDFAATISRLRQLVWLRRVLDTVFCVMLWIVLFARMKVIWISVCSAEPLIFIAGVLLIGPIDRRYRRARELIAKLDYRVCPNCDYDLRGSPDEYRCPECGKAIGPELNRSSWSERLKDRARWLHHEKPVKTTTSAPPSQTAPPPQDAHTP